MAVVHRRAVLAREATADGRSVTMLAVPWDAEIRLSATEVESFARGAFDEQIRAGARPVFTLNHMRSDVKLTDQVIGKVTSMRSTAEGLQVSVRMASTSTAVDALALIADGVLNEVSIGFVPQDTLRSRRPDGSTLLRRTRARLDHIAAVLNGAYGPAGAKVLGVRTDPPAVAELRAVVARERDRQLRARAEVELAERRSFEAAALRRREATVADLRTVLGRA